MAFIMKSVLIAFLMACAVSSTLGRPGDEGFTQAADRAKTTTPMPVMTHQLTIALQNKTKENGASKHNGADLWVTLYGNKATSAKLHLTPKKHDFVPGRTYSFLMAAGKDLGTVRSVVMYWKANSVLITTPKQSLWLEGNVVLRDLSNIPVQYRPTVGPKFEEKKDYLTTKV
ncbi:hypothetical protein RvY_12501 [Ramazzottius varieornatus]|uniref:PLAT domain-containing protein n=1 Tax=Ramazzottius varieornatus TaxID=947166 RepID=A0A1D1VTH0_RAMVA|nr:hypothetical protein RvY_12501 [Ramazzottius varieornatus]